MNAQNVILDASLVELHAIVLKDVKLIIMVYAQNVMKDASLVELHVNVLDIVQNLMTVINAFNVKKIMLHLYLEILVMK